jgi:hypothetical protein
LRVQCGTLNRLILFVVIISSGFLRLKEISLPIDDLVLKTLNFDLSFAARIRLITIKKLKTLNNMEGMNE